MATTPVLPVPVRLDEATFVIEGADGSLDYTYSVSQALFQPDQGLPGIRAWTDGTYFLPSRSVEWTLAIEYPQDWSTASSLSLYLALHAGEQHDVTFTPKAGSYTVRANVTLAPGPIGGQAGTMLTGVVVMGVNGAPSLEEAA